MKSRFKINTLFKLSQNKNKYEAEKSPTPISLATQTIQTPQRGDLAPDTWQLYSILVEALGGNKPSAFWLL